MLVDGFPNATEAVIRNIGVPYQVVHEDGSRDSTADLRNVLIEAGVELQFADDIGLEMNDVTVNGTAAAPVVFTHLPGSATSTWGGIALGGRGDVVRYARIENAGAGPGSSGGALAASQFGSLAGATIENVEIVDSRTWGVFCDGSRTQQDSTIVGLTVSGSVAGDVHPACRVTVVDDPAPDGPRVDASACAQVLVERSEISTPFVFSNTDADCDYHVVGNYNFRSTVLFEPGVNLVFARDASLSVNGTVTALGSAESPVTLRSEVTEDGYWGGLSVSGTASRLQHVQLTDAGAEGGEALRFFDGTVDARLNTDISLTDSTVSGSLGDGVRVSGSVDIVDFAGNTFIGNAGHGLQVPFDQTPALDAASLYDSPMAPNGREGIRLIGNLQSRDVVQLGRDDTGTLRNLGAAYRIAGLSVTDGAELTVEAGTEIAVEEGGSIGFNRQAVGNLNGTATSPVVIRGASGVSGWTGLFVTQSNLTAANLRLSGGGTGGDDGFRDTTTGALNISVNSSTVSLTDVSISDSAGWGIDCEMTDPNNFTFSNVTYADNVLGTINPECGS